MDEAQRTQMILAVRTLRELLDNPDRDDWDELLAAYRVLRDAFVSDTPMRRKDRARVAEYLREAGWRERAIGVATAQTGVHAGADGVIPSMAKTIC